MVSVDGLLLPARPLRPPSTMTRGAGRSMLHIFYRHIDIDVQRLHVLP